MIFLSCIRNSRETTVPGPDKPTSPLKFLKTLVAKGLHFFLDELHGKYGGMASFYLHDKLYFSINDEEVLSKEPNPPIPLIQSFRNFRSEPKTMERQRFRQAKKWLQGKKNLSYNLLEFFGNWASIRYNVKISEK